MILFALFSNDKPPSDNNSLKSILAAYQKNGKDDRLLIEILESVEGKERNISILIARLIPEKWREDFKQNLFIEMRTKIGQADIKSNPKGYIYTSIKNFCYKFNEKKDFKFRPQVPLIGIERPSKNQDKELSKNIDHSELIKKIRAFLSENEWLIIYKKYGEGKSLKDGARELGISDNQFRGKLFRIVQKIRTKFGNDFGELFQR